MILIYGIKNCDTIKKTLRWFDTNNAEYQFVDYKKEPPSAELAQSFLSAHHWEIVVDKRGTTWRKLDDSIKQTMDQEQAVGLIQDHPSLIKRPIVEYNGNYWVGYDETIFERILNGE